MLLAALKTIHIQEKDGFMHLSEVRKIPACDLKIRHPESTTMCSSRSNSLDKVNTEFPALVLDKSLKNMTEPELDV
eukprot:12883010-Prorocentrum_lima.AAC.1